MQPVGPGNLMKEDSRSSVISGIRSGQMTPKVGAKPSLTPAAASPLELPPKPPAPFTKKASIANLLKTKSDHWLDRLSYRFAIEIRPRTGKSNLSPIGRVILND